MEIQWRHTDPESGERWFLRARRFAGVWSFEWKGHRRDDWSEGVKVTSAMWAHILDCLERRYWRREGVEQVDIDQVKKLLAEATREEERWRQ